MHFESAWTPTPYVVFRHRAAAGAAKSPCKWVERRVMPPGAEYNERGLALRVTCPQCGKGGVAGVRLLARDSGKVAVCAARCMSASGEQCDCPCRGENHGMGHR